MIPIQGAWRQSIEWERSFSLLESRLPCDQSALWPSTPHKMAAPVNLHSTDVPHDLKTVIQADEDNQNCFECQAKHPTWASVSLGVMLCMPCAGKHRGLGTHLSTVRSLTLDNWQPRHITSMKLGGNSRAKEALADVLEERDLRTKYESPQAEEHRNALKKEVHTELGLPLEETPVQRTQTPQYSAGNDPRFQNATSISSDQFYRRPGPQNPDKGWCPCTIL